MPVYVDDARIPYGRMRMSHMIADAPGELYKMAGWIGLDFKWLQQRAGRHDYFDICQSKRAQAIKLGAIPVSTRELAKKARGRG